MKPGDKIGRYEVIERVGRGGMGVLYRGRDPVLDREVAIKVMSGDFSSDEVARARFFREARAAARLQHRNIVTIFEFAEDHDTAFIAMEFLRGQSLASRMTSAPPLTTVQKLDIVTQLCTGLHYAHEQGIVHRDVKPGNIWITEDGTVKLLDFGIAKVAASTMTQSGSVMGSASYMAPEQVAGRELDGRADVFSAGVVLYELLAKRKPFEAEAPTAVMMKILNEEPPPLRQFAPDVPPALADAVMKALQKDPDKRYLHAGDFGAELRLIRLSLERTTDTAIEEAPEFAPTMYIPPTPGAQDSPSAAHRLAAADPAASASLAGGTVRTMSESASGGRFATWIAVAALAVSAVLATIVLMQRSSSPVAPASTSVSAAPAAAAPTTTAAPAPSASAGVPAVQPAAAAAVVKIVSDPEGAQISIGGVDTGLVTPADVSREDVMAARVRLSKPGYRPATVRATDAQLQSGVVLARLEPVPVGVAVSLSAPFAFEVLQGSKVISPAKPWHEFTLAQPGSLRLRASSILLDTAVKVDGSSGRFSYELPAPGRLTVRTRKETCTVFIGGRDFGYPPVNDQQLAPGTHTVELRCPDEADNASKKVTIASGQSVIEVVQ
ncbi:MAG TPA: serine/threonine-protein kinase [Vicinamibacterales bacterium]|nr:serine/threonine-protein kinase [Vicinamibacterales bacterium]